ncbi:sensor histidine kinase [Carboxylicivirga linearis]|uniref:histidine kinase n=1 Tax=Carboxylicivirga linearis TaxID=1628157 RepID=A0ABS5JR58_9BACT|nr:ATP-binding protein [Carboxylicivirga linearis]MBS2097371.1 hypothetical protein [Carboxylicivirga linearis]
MWNSKLQSIYQAVIPAEMHFRNRFALKTIALGVILGFIATLFNLIIGLQTSLTIFTFAITLFFSWLYWVARFKNKYLIVRKSFTIFMLFTLNGLWLLNGGSNGPTLLIFQAVFALGLFIIPAKSFLKTSIIFAINITALFIFEYYFPNVILGYKSEFHRLLDIYHISIIFLISEIPLIYYANKNYKAEQIKAEKSEQVKSAFLANMSHEIRTPMNVLLGFSELLRDKEINEDEKNQYLDIIQQNGTLLLRILDNILDLSKLDARTVLVKENSINLDSFLENVRISHSNKAIQKDLDIKVKNNSLLQNSLIISDDNILLQIFNNLVNNAIKFTDKGAVTIGYTINENGSKIQFFVKDSGIGIHPSILPFVFERFRQGDERLKREYSGAGLGLTISKALVELLNGKIWIKTAVNVGTTVYFSIDLNIAKQLDNNQVLSSAMAL